MDQPVQVDVKKEAKMWKRKNADQRVKRTFKTADEVLKARARLLSCRCDCGAGGTRDNASLRHGEHAAGTLRSAWRAA